MTCTNLNILVGTNSSGKSTILQAILLVSQNLTEPCGITGKLVSLGEFEEARCWNSKEKSIIVKIDTEDDQAVWKIYNEDELLQMDISSFKDAKSQINFNYKSGNLSYLSCNRIGAQDIYEKIHLYEPKVGINGEYAIDFLLKHKDSTLDIEICKFKDMLTLGNQVNGWLNYIVGANIRTEDIIRTDFVKATFKVQSQKETRPKNVGSGVSYLISILVLCLSSKKENIMIIENPEIHLHPLAQSRVCEFLYYIASHGRQIFVETHSDHLFNSVRAGIATEEMESEKVQINFISLDSECCSQNTMVEIGKRGKICNPQQDLFDQFDNDLNKMLGL